MSYPPARRPARTSRSLLLALALTAIAPGQGFGQEAVHSLDADLELLCELLDQRRQEQRIPGMALGIVLEGELILARGFGHRDVEQKLPVEPDTLFAIGSSTKAFTATAIAMLVEEGRMAWDDPVREHLPEFQLSDPTANEMVTIRDLLCHRTGLTRMPYLWAANAVPRDAVIRQVREAELYRPYHSAFLYNNVMYLAAGMAAGNAAGTSWEELIETRILQPLGMTSSYTRLRDAREDLRIARGYLWEEEEDDWRLLPYREVHAVSPAGAIWSNVLDMSHWLKLQLDEGAFEGEQLVSEELLAETWSMQALMPNMVSYGLGWMIRQWDGERVILHGGNIDGFAANVALLPAEEAGMVILLNVTQAPLQNEAVDLVWETVTGHFDPARHAPREPWSRERLAPYLGRYDFPPLNAELTVQMKGDRLAVDVPGQTLYVLRWPDEEGLWPFELTDQIGVRFAEPVDGKCPSFAMLQSGMEMEATRIEDGEGPSREGLGDILALRRKALGLDQGDPPASFRLRGTVDAVHQGVSGTLDTWGGRDGRFRDFQDYGLFGTTELVVDGESGWTESMTEPRRSLSAKEAAEWGEFNPWVLLADWRRHFGQIELVREEEQGGRPVAVLRAIPREGRTVMLRLDGESGLPVRIDLSVSSPSFGSVPITIRLDDYRPLGEVRFPFRQVLENPHTGETVYQYESVELDPSWDAAFSQQPASHRGDD